MADWVDIDNTTIEPDAPLISSTVFALRDNPQAIAEGAPGAPRVENAAIAADSLDAGKTLAVEAGDVVRFSTFSQEFNTTSTSYTTVLDQRFLNTGVIRITFEHVAVSPSISSVRVLVNGSVAETWTNSGAQQSQSGDISISRNARVQVQHKTDDDLAKILNIRIRTSGGGLWPGAEGFVY